MSWYQCHSLGNVELMVAKIKVVDLFAGPGGLAEGFSSVRNQNGQRIFEIALSVEKEASAHRTLRLRSFFRQFAAPPAEYYDYVAGMISHAVLHDRDQPHFQGRPLFHPPRPKAVSQSDSARSGKAPDVPRQLSL